MKVKDLFAYIRDLVTIEPLICCVVIASTVCSPALTNLNFEKACKVNAGFNDTVCAAILQGTYLENNFKEQNNIVQHYLTNLRSWEVPVSSVVPVILILFLGSYSDRHKIRKPFLLIPIVGEMLSLIGSILSVIYMREWSLEIQAVCDKVVPSIFGSEKLIVMISSAYFVDISSPEMRTLKLAVIPILLSVCIPLTQAVSGILFKAVGYIPIFSAGLLLLMIAFLNGVCMVKEPLEKETTQKSSITELIKDVFNVKHLVETFSILVQNKGGMRFNFLTLLVLCFFLHNGEHREYNTFFLFTQTAYRWTVVDYSYYTTLGTILNCIGLSVLLPVFTRTFHLNDLIIIFISSVDTIFVNSIFVLYASPVGLYIGRILAILKHPGRAVTKSQLTKYVPDEDVAKALSLYSVVDALAATVAAQVYHRGIYEYTRETFPQAFFLLGVVIHIGGVFLLIWMYLKNRDNDSTSQKEQNDSPDKEIIPPEAHVTYI